MVFLSNVSLSNDTYNFQNSNGYIQLQQSPTISSTVQFTTYHQYNQNNNVKLFYGDSQSNISISHSNYQSNSSLYISLNNSNIFSTSNVPYVSYSNASNVFQFNVNDSTINLLINNSNLLKIASLSNSIPNFYNSNADIYFYGSSNLKISSISYQPIGVISNPMIFKQPIQAPSVSACNINQLSNTLYNTSNQLYNQTAWSSNNLLNKNTGGTINGSLILKGTTSPGAGFYSSMTFTNPAGGYGGLVIDHTPTYGSMNLLSNSDDMLNVKLYNESKFIVKKETGWVGVNTSNPSTTLDINGTINATQYVGSTITNLSNLGLFGSNTSVSASNIVVSLSNYLFGSNISNITNAQTTANWSSNNLVKKTGDTISGNLTVSGLINTNTIQNNVGLTYIKGEYDINYTADYDGNNGGAAHVFNSYSNERLRITPAGNVGIGTNNPQYKLDVAGSINASNYTGATITSLSNLAMFGSNTALYSSNQTISLSNFLFGSNTSNITTAQITANWASNAGLFGSNLSVYSSNSLISLSNYTYSNLTNTSNYIYSNIPSLCNFISSVSNYSYVNIPSINNSFSSLSNYTYNLSTSNSTLCNVFTTNVYTKTVNATDGGSLGALVVGATGLALGGYNLFNNSGKLTNALTDALGKVNIDPSTGIANFIQGLFGYGRFTDAVDIGVATITLSNNSIYFKNSNTSNTIYTSNAINVINSNISTFTISNANLYTNCNITACNISLLSNATYWCSNNLINKNGDTFIGNVGIGSAPSLIPLEITKSLSITSNDSTYISILSNLGGIGNFTGTLLRSGDYGTQSMLMYAGGSYTNGRGIIQCKDILNVRNSPNPLLLNPIGGSVGIGCCNPSYTLDVNGTVNATSYVGSTITNLSNLGVFGSNTSTSASNTVISLSNYVYNSVATNITNSQTTANWASNAGLFGSNTSISASNNVISLSNYVYGTLALASATNTTNITNAQTTASWASNAGLFGSNTSTSASNTVISLSNYVYGTNTTNITNAQTTANWSSNASLFSSNNVISLSNAYYTSSTNSIAVSASNVAYWSSNNINWNQLQNKPFQVWKSDWLGGSVNSVGYYKIATLADTGNGANGTGIEINGWCGGFGAEKMSFKCLVKSRSGVSMKGYTQGTYQSNYDILLYQEADNTFSLYFYNGDYYTSWYFEINADTTYGATLLTPTSTKTTPTGTLNTKMTSNLVIVANGVNVGVGTSNPTKGKFEVNGVISTNQNGEARYHLFNNGGVAEWKFGQKTSSSHNFIVSKSVNNVDSDYLVIDTSGNVGVGTTSPSYKLDVAGDIIANSWIRTRNSTGWYNETYGGGVYMTDTTWIRTYGTKNFFHDGSIMRTDGQLHIGNGGSTFLCSNGGDLSYRANVLYANTAGNVGIGTSNPLQKLDVVGNINSSSNIYATNRIGIGTSLPLYDFDCRGNAQLRGAASKNAMLSITDSNLVAECRITAHSNNRTYCEYYDSMRFQFLGLGTLLTQIPTLYLQSNASVCIGMSNNASCRLQIGGVANSYVTGPHQEFYTYSDAYPVQQNLNYAHDNTCISFDSYYDGTGWKSSTNTNNYQIYKLGGVLDINYSKTVAASSNIAFSNAIKIKASDDTVNFNTTTTFKSAFNGGSTNMTYLPYYTGDNFIRGNTNVCDTGGVMRVGASSGDGSALFVNGTCSATSMKINGSYMTYFRILNINCGTNSTDTKTISISIDSPQPPNSTYTVSGEFISDNNDIFTFKIRNRTSTSLDLVVYRVDGGGWSTAPTCLLTLIGYA